MMNMPLEEGDFILVDYVGKVKETGDIFETTLEEKAKEENLYEEGEIYEPKLVVIGEGWVLEALEESLTTMEVGKTQKVEIPPEKAFGERDPEKVRRVALRRLTSQGITPKPGSQVKYDGKMATVRTVGAGRALLDFNPPLAGKTLIYETTIQEKLQTRKEKIKSLIHRRIPAVEKSKFQLTAQEETARINMPEEAFYIEGIQLAKRGIAMDIQRFFSEMATIKFVETFEKEDKTET